jgi:hypothetical protein
MLRLLIFFSFILVSFGLSGQTVQYAWNYYEDAGNPNGINGAPSDPSNGFSSEFTIALQGPINTNRWTPVIPLPFPFALYGDTTSFIRASTNGLVTLDTLDTALLNLNTNLPEAGIPDQCISAFWSSFNQQAASAFISYRTYGTAPNRQFWIKWNDFDIGSADPVYMAVVLEESTHKIYIVDMFTSSPGLIGTVGIQSGAQSLQPTNGPVQMQGNSFHEVDNDYYEFFLLDSLNATIEAFNTLDEVFCGGLEPLTITVRNLGYTTIDSLVIGYGWNGPGTFDTIGGLNIGPNESDTMIIDTLFFLAGNTYDFEFYIENVNGIMDEDQSDDTLRIDDVQTGLMGSYTVDPNLPTSGTNFSNLTDVAFALNNWGICGAVDFTLAAETFDDHLYLQEIKGSSPAHTILIKGNAQDSTILTHDGIGRGHSIRLFGTDHLTIEDIHLIVPAIRQYESGIMINKGADSIRIERCSFTDNAYFRGAITSSPQRSGIRVSRDSNQAPNSSAAIADHITIKDCSFQGLGRGIYLLGDYGGALISDVTLTNNRIMNSSSSGMELRRCREMLITNNEVRSDMLNGYGMYVYAAYNYQVRSNEIYTADHALRLATSAGNTSYPRHIVENNILSSRVLEGLNIDGMNDVRLANNTIKGKVGAILPSDDEITILNNIFIGRSHAVHFDYFNFTIDSLDHNIYHSDTSDLIRYDNTYYSDLTAFQNAYPLLNQNSLELEPVFRRPTNLRRVDNFANNAAYTGLIMSEDIDGDPRNPSAFDIGADEFEPVAVDLDLLDILKPTGIVCEDNQQTVEVIIRNNGTDTLVTVPYQLSFIGTPSNFSTSDTIIVSIAPFETDTLLLSPFNTFSLDSGEFTITLQDANDAYTENDALSKRLVISHSQPTQPQYVGDTICAPDSMAVWTASAINGTALWYLNVQSDSIIHIGSPLEESIQSTTTRSLSFAHRPELSVGHIPQMGDSMGVPGGSNNLLLVFRAFHPFTLDSVTVYPGDTGWVKIADVQWDFNLGIGDTTQAVYRYVEPDSAFAPVRIQVGMHFEPGFHGLGTGDLNQTNGLLRTYEGLNFPYEIPDVVSIDGAASSRRYFYWFYDWKISYETCFDTNRYSVTAYFEDSDLSLPDDASICQEDSLNIVPTTSGGTFNSFLWMDGSTGSSYTATGATNVSVVGETTLGCVHEDFMVVDTFPSTPTLVPQDTTICDTGAVELPTLGGGFTTIWTYNGNTVSQATMPGMYIQEVEDANGCVAQDTFFMSTIDCDTVPFGIQGIATHPYRLFPNPSIGDLHILFEQSANDLRVRIYDGIGKLVTEQKESMAQELQLDLRSLSRGVYVVEVYAEGITHRSRWILQ